MKKFRTPVLFTLSLGLLVACSDPMVEETLTLQPDGTEGKDAVINSCIPCSYNDNNYGTSGEFTSIATTNSGDISNTRSLIQFDLSEIPENATVTSATLSLFAYSSPGNGQHLGSNNAKLLKVNGAWQENTITWDNQPTTVATGAVSLAQSLSSTQDYIDLDVTGLIQDMVSNPESNFGFMLKLDTETAYRALIFASSDNATAAIRPMLVVQYEYEE